MSGAIGNRLAEARALAGVSARELDRLSGASPGHAAAVERGEYTPKPATIAKWAPTLGVSEHWLVFGTGRGPSRAAALRAVESARSRVIGDGAKMLPASGAATAL